MRTDDESEDEIDVSPKDDSVVKAKMMEEEIHRRSLDSFEPRKRGSQAPLRAGRWKDLQLRRD